ncbi:hypothetical protein [Shewanella baltica]|uniref:hypothetical protein n=1 Tax=Shewanella baltica TaxID=62322 RepID=UPI003D79A449
MPVKMWPSDYPTFPKVPPLDAECIKKELYRIVRNVPPTVNDFLPTNKDPYQKHLHKKKGINTNPAFFGTSFFESKTPLETLLRSHPQMFRAAKIAYGPILDEHGVAQSSSSGHVSVWFYDGVYPQGFIAE